MFIFKQTSILLYAGYACLSAKAERVVIHTIFYPTKAIVHLSDKPREHKFSKSLEMLINLASIIYIVCDEKKKRDQKGVGEKIAQAHLKERNIYIYIIKGKQCVDELKIFFFNSTERKLLND